MPSSIFAAVMATTKRARATHTKCPNCGRTLRADEHFCAHCGQENHDLHAPITHLLMEVLEGVLHFDGKSFRTIGALLFKPGFLTAEFRVGRRVRYVPPVRLYVFISFLFFLLLSLLPSPHRGTTGNVSDASNELGVTFREISSKELKGLTPIQVDSLVTARGIERTSFNTFMIGQLVRIADEGRVEFGHRLLKGVTYTMFVLMPIFALLVYLFYRRKAGYYIDCLVYSVHFHSFAFLLLTVVLLLRQINSGPYVVLASPLVLAGYNYFSLRRVFGEKRGRTFLKTVGVSVLYVVSIVVCFTLMIFVNLLLF